MPDVLSRYLVQLFGWKPHSAADIVGDVLRPLPQPIGNTEYVLLSWKTASDIPGFAVHNFTCSVSRPEDQISFGIARLETRDRHRTADYWIARMHPS